MQRLRKAPVSQVLADTRIPIDLLSPDGQAADLQVLDDADLINHDVGTRRGHLSPS